MTNYLSTEQIISSLSQWGQSILAYPETLKVASRQAELENPWFTQENIELALNSIAKQFLNVKALNTWLAPYKEHQNFNNSQNPKEVGIVMAGNIPLVGFHDLLSVLVTQNKALVKCSSKDKKLLPVLIALLKDLDPILSNRIKIVERLQNYDAVVATGSNNSARYFETYFSKVPNIIRKNRHSVAILDGTESDEEIISLGKDLFSYFGLGCRNVSKLFVPPNFDFVRLFDLFQVYKEIGNHNKYKNNLDYNVTIQLMNRKHHFASEFLLMMEDDSLSTPPACINYSFYKNEDELSNQLIDQKDQIQCIVADSKHGEHCIKFGEAQNPNLSDYADNIDTLKFLFDLKN